MDVSPRKGVCGLRGRDHSDAAHRPSRIELELMEVLRSLVALEFTRWT